MSTLKVIDVPVGQLELDPANVRTHDAKNLKAIADSLKLFGQRKQIVAMQADDGFVVIAGNGTLEAAKELGWTHLSVAVAPSDWTSDQAAAFAIADNRTAELAAWDQAGLEMQLKELEAAAWDLEALGFEAMGMGADDVEEDEVPEVPEEPVTKLGDLWLLGNHRLLCGDSTKLESIARLMAGEKAAMVFTDPPWNVNYGAVAKDNAQGYKPRTILNDSMGTDEFLAFMMASFTRMAEFSLDGAPTYVVMSAQEWGNMMLALDDCGYHWSSTVIWNKDTLVLSRKDYHTKYEPIWYGWKNGAPRLCPVTDRKQSDVWDIVRPKVSEEHPTMKPLGLIARALGNSSSQSAIVMDQFAGSGSTLIACEQMGRICRTMELDPAYCDVIVKRWENLTGGTAVLEQPEEVAS